VAATNGTNNERPEADGLDECPVDGAVQAPRLGVLLRSIGYRPPQAKTTTPPEPKPLPANDSADPYLLRDLLWCGLCDEPFAACLMSTGVRYYGCMNQECRRPLVPAEETEQLVWKGFVLRYEAVAGGLKRDQRQAALHDAFERVTVHSGASELDFAWRE
jgi:hypothetical protein